QQLPRWPHLQDEKYRRTRYAGGAPAAEVSPEARRVADPYLPSFFASRERRAPRSLARARAAASSVPARARQEKAFLLAPLRCGPVSRRATPQCPRSPPATQGQ